jgi:hypothetical protein
VTLYPTPFGDPGTTVASEGRPVHVDASRETSGITIGAIRGGLSKVSGIAIRANGESAAGATVFRSRRVIGGSTGTADKTTDGRFTAENLQPGDYLFWSSLETATGREQALMPVADTGEPVVDVVLAMRKDISVRGRVVVNGGNASLRTGSLKLRGYEMEDPDFTNLDLTLNPDGTFEGSTFAGLTWLIRPTLPAGWFLERVTLGGRDVTDTPTQLSNDVSNMEIVLTRRASVLNGRVTGITSSSATVIAFATSAERWTPYPRFVGRVSTDAAGAFELHGLPPGGYAVVAVPSLPEGDEGNPEILSGWLPIATRVDLKNDATSTIALGLIR